MPSSPAYSLHLPLWHRSHQPPSLAPHSGHPAWLYMAWSPVRKKTGKPGVDFSPKLVLPTAALAADPWLNCYSQESLSAVLPQLSYTIPALLLIRHRSGFPDSSPFLLLSVGLYPTGPYPAGSSVPSAEQSSPAGGSHLPRRKLTPFVS